MNDRLKLDIAPIPESVLYVNDKSIADESIDRYDWGETLNVPTEDVPHGTVRIYVPLDISRDDIMRRFGCIQAKYEEITWKNSANCSNEIDQLIKQLEILDRVMCARSGIVSTAEARRHRVRKQ